MPKEIVPIKASFGLESWRPPPSKSIVVVSYNRQRIMRQLGYNQGAVIISDRMAYSSALNVGARFIVQSRDEVLANVVKFSSLGKPRQKYYLQRSFILEELLGKNA